MFEDMWRGLEVQGSWDGEFWNMRKNGEEYAERLSVTAITNAAGEVQQFAAIMSDITKRKQDEERILYQANYDNLTGLPNRSLFLDRLNQSLSNMQRASRNLGLLFIDLDGFKLVNDTLGHNIGDLLLKEAARRLGTCVRTGDTVARLGGDEFTIIMPNLDDPKNAPLVAQRVLDSLQTAFLLGGHETFVSASIGITIFPDDASDAQDLLKNADAAMYRAKEHGKANYQFFTSDMNEQVKERLIVKNGLSRALDHDEFILLYQPKLNLNTGRVVSAEALMRWESPDLGLVSPVKFIPVLEETGMVVEVGAWAIHTACFQHIKWLKQGLPPIKIAVNLSARQLRDPGFVKIVKNALDKYSLPPSALEIEITESMLMSDAPNIVVSLKELHDYGVHISMDDFGTGYSSLSYLKRFPIDTIKIDRSFVSDIDTSLDDAEIIHTIINMGQTLNRRVIAEGVETQEQLDILRRYNCDEIQGYFFSRPLDADVFAEFINNLDVPD
jgi:diguanylate cyclase (GGDEF)-like protein